MDFLRAYLRTLNPPLPTSVRTLQAGALINALGNGLAYPFLFIYLHNVRGIDLATAGLIVGTNSAVGLVAGPIIGSLIDKIGGRITLGGSLWLMAVGFGGYAFVESPWQGFLASAVAGIGNGGFWPSQSTIIAVGECLHGTVQAPLVVDLADHSLIGRYMAASAFSWGVGFAFGPAVGGLVLNHWPHLLWPAAAAVCLAAGGAALALERALPDGARTTPKRGQPAFAEA